MPRETALLLPNTLLSLSLELRVHESRGDTPSNYFDLPIGYIYHFGYRVCGYMISFRRLGMPCAQLMFMIRPDNIKNYSPAVKCFWLWPWVTEEGDVCV